MTPLEQVAMAIFKSESGPDGRPHPEEWQSLPERDKEFRRAEARAAILALVTAHNLPTLVEVEDEHGTILAFAPDDHADFRAILRAIAEGKSSDPT